MDGQNFENENNVTVDTTATEVSSAAETVQETPVTEQPVNNYQDYTANVQPQAAATAPVQQPENKETNVLAIVSLVLGILPSYLDAAPDGSAHCLESVVSFAQYLPTSRARPAWQRLD